MTSPSTARLRALAAALVLAAAPAIGQPRGPSGPVHGIAMYGAPALPPDFVALPYANPDAPQGGRLVLPEIGSFDSLNPYVQRGTAPWGVGLLTVEPLMARSWDEPFTLYGLLAESVETDADRSYVAFTLRPEARFSDGSPVTVEDVIWSFETLGTRGHARFRAAWGRVAAIAATGPQTVRIDFTTPDRELPLIMGLRPVLQRAQFDEGAGGLRFEDGGMTPVIGSGPYVVASAEPGRQITFRRNPDWWARDLPVVTGLHNFDEIRWDYFGDQAIAFEAFKAGHLSVWREQNPARWADSYEFPAVRDGRVVLRQIPHGRPTGIDGFVINTRRAPFDDWRLREALIGLFDFARANTLVTGGVLPRIASPFGNSPLAHAPGTPAEGREGELLAPFADTLPPDTLTGWALPPTGGSDTRRAQRAAGRLLDAAGWEPDARGQRRNAAGEALALTLLLPQGQTVLQTVATTYIESLQEAGIDARLEVIDPAQYVLRTQSYDFDLTHMLRLNSLSPGYEQVLYWGSEGREAPGTRNLAGLAEPAIDAMIRTLVETDDPETFIAAARALDRVVMATRALIPLWFSPYSRLAHDARLAYPARLPLYGDWTGFLPEVWWQAE
jgi:peptide/nickel transport system substrate-binding protein